MRGALAAGIAVVGNSSALVPEAAELNGSPCKIFIRNNISGGFLSAAHRRERHLLSATTLPTQHQKGLNTRHSVQHPHLPKPADLPYWFKQLTKIWCAGISTSETSIGGVEAGQPVSIEDGQVKLKISFSSSSLCSQMSRPAGQRLCLSLSEPQQLRHLSNNVHEMPPRQPAAHHSHFCQAVCRDSRTKNPVQIIGTDGTPVTLKCANYFGFNNGQTMFDGLYAGEDDLALDVGRVIYRIQVQLCDFVTCCNIEKHPASKYCRIASPCAVSVPAADLLWAASAR